MRPVDSYFDEYEQVKELKRGGRNRCDERDVAIGI
jgi:hypothetical protein